MNTASDDARRAMLAAPPPSDGTARLFVVSERAIGMMIEIDMIVGRVIIT